MEATRNSGFFISLQFYANNSPPWRGWGWVYCYTPTVLRHAIAHSYLHIVIQEINHILNNWNYQSALELFKKLEGNPHLAEILSSSESPFFTKKLKNELLQIRNAAPSHPEPVEGDVAQMNVSTETQTIHPESHPEPVEGDVQRDVSTESQLTAIKKERNTILRRQDQLRWQNVLLVEQNATPEQLRPNTVEIMEISHRLNELWYQLDYHQNHGVLPPKPVDEIAAVFDDISDVDLPKIRNNYRSNVSKAKNGKLPSDRLPFYEAVKQEAERRIALA